MQENKNRDKYMDESERVTVRCINACGIISRKRALFKCIPEVLLSKYMSE